MSEEGMLSHELAEARLEIARLKNAEAGVLMDEVTRLTETLAKTQAELAEAKATIKECTECADRYADQVAKWRDRVEFLERQVKTNEEVIEERKLQIADLERENEKLEQAWLSKHKRWNKAVSNTQRAAYERALDLLRVYRHAGNSMTAIIVNEQLDKAIAAISKEMEKGGE